jgi:transcriptional regulator with XRE-family HTH domain
VEDFVRTFGVKLKTLRESAGLSQTELAEKAGLGQRALSFWERGAREPAWSAVVKLANALGVDLHVFLDPIPTAETPKGRGKQKAATVRKATQPGRHDRGRKQ